MVSKQQKSASSNLSWKAIVIAMTALGFLSIAPACRAQAATDTASSLPDAPEVRPATGSQPLNIYRVFGLVPVVDAPILGDNHVAALSNKQKFQYFLRTTIDPGTAVIAVVGAGIEAKSTTQPAYGGGAAAFGQKTGAIAADYASNTLFSRSLLPMLFRQDPRFFRKEDGSVASRIFYGATRAFVTETDSGHSTLNTSFLGGNAMSVALSNAYFPDRNRNAADSASRYGEGIGINMAINVFREFWKLGH
jgi:hypothetical protein